MLLVAVFVAVDIEVAAKKDVVTKQGILQLDCGRRLERLGDYLLQGHTLAVLRLELPPSAQMKSNP